MKKYLKITPEGTKDFLFAECSAMDDICGKIEQVFVTRGFKKVITPGIEVYDVFSVPCSGISQCEMALLKLKMGKLEGNFIEGMACEGGCVQGAGCLVRSHRGAGGTGRGRGRRSYRQDPQL